MVLSGAKQNTLVHFIAYMCVSRFPLMFSSTWKIWTPDRRTNTTPVVKGQTVNDLWSERGHVKEDAWMANEWRREGEYRKGGKAIYREQ